MTWPQTRRSPAATGLRGNTEKRPGGHLKSTTRAPRLPASWRQRLPDPGEYYRARVAQLGAPDADGWAQGRCPFHDDPDLNLSVRLAGRGTWRCYDWCGKGDLVAFHQRLTRTDFAAAIRDLVRRAER